MVTLVGASNPGAREAETVGSLGSRPASLAKLVNPRSIRESQVSKTKQNIENSSWGKTPVMIGMRNIPHRLELIVLFGEIMEP